MDNEIIDTAVPEAPEGHQLLPATTMENETIAEVHDAPGHGISNKAFETPANRDSVGLSETNDNITADLEVQKDEDSTHALEATKCHLSAIPDFGTENQSFLEEKPSSLDGIKASQVYPHNEGPNFGNGRQTIPDEFEALANWTYNSQLGSDLFVRRNNLSGDNPDDENVNGDINVGLHGAKLDTEKSDTSMSAALSDEDLYHSSSDEPLESDDEKEDRDLQAPLCCSTVSAEIPQQDNDSKQDTSKTRPPVKKAAVSGQRATRKRSSRQARHNILEKDINISEREMTRSKELGLRKLSGHNELTALFYQLIENDKVVGSVSAAGKKPRSAIKEAPLQRLEHLLSIGSAIQAVQKNAHQPGIPTSESLNKETALKEITTRVIEENPNFDPRDVRKDARNLITASRMFKHPPKMDGVSGWIMHGMKRNLFNHQLDGAGWMCNREKEDTIPRGGMLCDMMGLGKTHTTLSCILDDSIGNLPGQMAPTLVIIPGNARGHWHRQISLGFDTGALGSVWDWNFRVAGIYMNNINGFKQHGIVLATYDDVRRSYPLSRVPKSLLADEEKAEWWRNNFESQLGLMHKINWHRIVLDEAQAIRNKSVTSVAVRALTGERKWILTGTPLYNSKEDLQPYFSFLGVRDCELQKSFHDQFSRGYEDIVNLQRVLEPFYRRRTFESTCFCLPIVPMPGAKEEQIMVEFSNVEKVIYDEILNKQIEKLNGKSKIYVDECWLHTDISCTALPGGSSSKSMLSPEQNTCILETMIRLRQFSSHFLTAFKAVKPLIGAIESALEDETEETDDFLDRDSKELWGFIELLKSGSFPATASLETLPCTKVERKIFENRIALKRASREQARRLAAAESWDEYDSIVAKECVECLKKLTLDRPFLVTSCHLYCKECYEGLRSQNGVAELQKIVCLKCRAEIPNAVDFHPFGSLLAATGPRASGLCPGKKRKRGNAGRNSRNKSQRANRNSNRDEERDESSDSEDSSTDDWIPLIEEYHLGATWLGSKMTKVRDIIRKWLLDDKDTKIVIFTHFRASLRILEMICKEEKWLYQKISGEVDAIERDNRIQVFQNVSAYKILLSTSSTGGASIDLTAANKCIVLDGWWNMAHDEQAFCRLLRIGQDRDVEVLRIIATGTLDGQDSIDKQMHDMQKFKMTEIFEVMGAAAFQNTGAAKSFLQNMGHIIHDRMGRIKLVRRDRRLHRRAKRRTMDNLNEGDAED
ncbi:uncharacterized protein N7443_002611 [Penicillium atrosanguineum]|uniref:uncharacterized protein n=1 Tax=Penicillium atrosanguineum TaxID=1132637 RepID=UPI00238250A5|nr:uncharacterized protein N7443_002611 [Penicillium atrosanguineum]KAJ5310150.1 hypothetical protein N7443_002611 [Penicillium atrosanguineum]